MKRIALLAVVVLAFIIIVAAPAGAQGVTTMQLATLKNIGGLSISPSGRYIVYQAYQGNPQTNNYSNQWFVIDTNSGRSRPILEDGGDPVLAYEDNTELTDYRDDWASFNPIWSSNDTLYYVRKHQGIITIHRHQLSGGDSLMHGYVGNVFAFHQLDDRSAMISTRAPSKESEAEAVQLQRNGLIYFDGSSDPDVYTGPPDMTPLRVPHYFKLDLASGSSHAVPAGIETGGEDPQTVRKFGGLYALYMAKSPDGRQRAFVGLQTTTSPITAGLYLISADGKSPTKVMSLGLNDSSPLGWARDSRHVYYVGHTHYIGSDLFVVDTQTKRVRQLTNASAYLYNCSFNRDVTLAACAIETASRPTNVALVHLATGKVSVLTNLNPDFERNVAGIRTQTLVWKNKWSDTLFGTLTYPRDYMRGKRYPLVFLTYWDQGFQRGGSGDEYPIFPLAERGFFVLNVDVSEAGPTHEASVHAPGAVNFRNWEGPLDGMTSMAKKLIAQGLVDPQGIGIGGLSYGSELSLYAASHSPMFRAAIGSHGGTYRDPFDYYFKGHAWDGIWRSWGLDGPPYGKNLAKWKLLSPALRADETRAAILMNSNDKEYIPGLQQFWELRDRHKPVEFWIFNDENHTKHQPIHRLTIYNRNVDWYAFWLAGKTDPNPSKHDQYKRWEHLRALEEKP